MNKMTQEENSKQESKADLDSAQVEAVLQENQTYKSLWSMQNESYYRVELVNSITTIQNLLAQINKTLDGRLEDLNKILIDTAQKK